MPNLLQLTFSMMIQINAFTSAQAVKLATDSKTSYEGLEASRISKITLPNFTNPVDTSHGNVTTAVEAEVNVTMIKSKDIQSSLASINVNASKVTTNEMFANTKLIQYLIPKLKSNLKKRIWISCWFLLQKQLKITLKRKMITWTKIISKITCHRDLIGNDPNDQKWLEITIWYPQLWTKLMLISPTLDQAHVATIIPHFVQKSTWKIFLPYDYGFLDSASSQSKEFIEMSCKYQRSSNHGLMNENASTQIYSNWRS